MKILNGAELAGFIKERQAKQVRTLRQDSRIFPKLAIITTTDNPVIDTYVRLKKTYGEDILIEVEIHKVSQLEVSELINNLNTDPLVHGCILQLPIEDPIQTDSLVAQIIPVKDVDALGPNTLYDSATATAINWLLAGYNINLQSKKIVLVGHGRLVGAPLAKMWRDSGFDVTVLDENTSDIRNEVQHADVLITAVGKPDLITSDMIRPDTVVVDAATTSENGKLVGDVAEEVRERDDLTITPLRGGVGPLTVAALFDNVIRAARATIVPKS